MWRMDWEQVNSTEGLEMSVNQTEWRKQIMERLSTLIGGRSSSGWLSDQHEVGIWQLQIFDQSTYIKMWPANKITPFYSCFVPTRRSQATVTVKRCTHTHTHTYRQTNKLSGEVDPFLLHYHTHSSTYLSPPGPSGSSPSTDRSLAAEAGHVHRQQHNSLTVQHETAINHKNGARPTDDYGRINTCHHSEENLKMLSRTTAMRLEWTSKWITVKHL